MYWTRTLKRLDLSARTIIALVEPGSCFAGTLAELVLAADRTYMLDGTWSDTDDPDLARPSARRRCACPTRASDGTRCRTGCHACRPASTATTPHSTRRWPSIGKELLADEASAAGLVTFTPDDIDWHDEIRLVLEERNSFSPDALTGMEANHRFVGPETMETKIFSRLTAWQNWIFQRPNAVGPDGALRRYGTGSRATY